MDQDFIADDDEENTQELSGLTITGEEESQSQSRDSHHPRWGAPSRRVSPSMQPPPQWFLDGMKEISDTGSDDDEIVGYLAGRSRKKQAVAGTNKDDEVPIVSREPVFGIPESDPHSRMQTNWMTSQEESGDTVPDPRHGFAESKNRHSNHPTLHPRTITTHVARVRKA